MTRPSLQLDDIATFEARLNLGAGPARRYARSPAISGGRRVKRLFGAEPNHLVIANRLGKEWANGDNVAQ
jgi:hypothetical protein